MKNENSLLRAPFKLGSSYHQLVEENNMLRRMLNKQTWKRAIYGVFFVITFYAVFHFKSYQEQIDEFPTEFKIERGR